jgi:serine/threonine-protein kinase HipA
VPEWRRFYDAVTTRVFARLKHDRLALKLKEKDDNFRRADFQALQRLRGRSMVSRCPRASN